MYLVNRVKQSELVVNLMKLSTRSRYGIHAMYELALNYGGSPVPIKSIAERRAIPEAYLEQLIAVLRRDGLVVSMRGALGGYTLSRSPAEITVGDVLRSMEDGLAVVDCLLEGDACGKSCDCPTRVIWQRLTDGIAQIVDNISLADMVAENAPAVEEL